MSIDKNIEDQFGRIGDIGWEERKMLHIDEDAVANPDGIFVAEVDSEIAGYIRLDLTLQLGLVVFQTLLCCPSFNARALVGN